MKRFDFRHPALAARLAWPLALLLPPTVGAWDQAGGPPWSDGTVEMHLHLGSSPAYDDGNTPDQVAADALQVWNPAMARVQFTARPGSTANRRFGNGINNVSFSPTILGMEWGEGTLAVTVSDYDTTRRLESDVIVNANLTWNRYEGAWRQETKDLRRVLVHEFGHVLGLDHPDEAGQAVTAIMNSTVSHLTGLQTDDLDGIGALYGHTAANPGRPPVLETAPQPLTIEAGLTLRLSAASVSGSRPFTFQWFKDGNALSEFTSIDLVKPGVTQADAGAYHVVVTNSAGALTTPPFLVTVVEPTGPVITVPDRNLTVSITAGSYYSITPHVVGSAPFTYQWYLNGLPMPGETGPSYGFANAAARHAGAYHVVVSNHVGTTSSPTVTVEVVPRPLPFAPNDRYSINAPETRVLAPGQRSLLRSAATAAGQWYFNGQKIPGATSTSLNIEHGVTAPGDYVQVVTNASGRSTSYAYRVVNEGDTAPASTGSPAPTVDPRAHELLVDRVMLDRHGHLILFSRFHRNLWIWSVAESRFIATHPLRGYANTAVYQPARDRVLLAYADGQITQLDPHDPTAPETPFATIDQPGVDLHVWDDVLLAQSRGNWGHTYTLFRADGTVADTRSGVYEGRNVTWNPWYRQLYVAGGFVLEALPLDTDLRWGNRQVMVYTNDPAWQDRRIEAPLALSPDGTRLLSGTGDIFDAINLQPVNRLPQSHDEVLWTADGLFIADTVLDGVTLSRLHPKTYAPERRTRVPGHSPRLFRNDKGQIIATTTDGDRFVISVFDADLRPVSRTSHRGEDLLAARARLTNLSTRVYLSDTGDGVLTAGFVIGGTEPLPVLVRAIGPGLGAYDITNFLADPTIKLFNAAGQLVAQNDGWRDGSDAEANALVGLFNQLGAFTPDPAGRDAALSITLPPGPYSAQVARGDQPGGVVLVEVYDASLGTSPSSLINLSTRMDTAPGERTLTAGFVLEGESDRPLLVRAAGPSLRRFGVSGALADPLLRLFQGANLIGQNDDWSGAEPIDLAARAAGAFAFDSSTSRDAATLVELAPGAYTTQVLTKADATGNAIVEVYQVDN